MEPALTPKDVISTFAGLRPLIGSPSREPSARTRDFRLWFSPGGLVSVAGGKYTTYRSMAQAVVDAAASRLGRRRPCRTEQVRLDGAPAQAWPDFEARQTAALCREHGLPPDAASHLVRRYGRRSRDVAAYLTRLPDLAKPIVAGEPDLQVELLYQREQEMAVCAADYWLRRTHLGLLVPGWMESASAELPARPCPAALPAGAPLPHD